MSTCSFIGKIENSVVETIYCHWDGYISGVGSILQKHFNSKQAVEELLTLNGISSLRSTLEETKQEAYDSENSYKSFCTPQDFFILLQKNWAIEYFYLFVDGKWKVLDFYNHKDSIKSAQNFEMVWQLFENLEKFC